MTNEEIDPRYRASLRLDERLTALAVEVAGTTKASTERAAALDGTTKARQMSIDADQALGIRVAALIDMVLILANEIDRLRLEVT